MEDALRSSMASTLKEVTLQAFHHRLKILGVLASVKKSELRHIRRANRELRGAGPSLNNESCKHRIGIR